jgi:hypothetical protein
LNNGAIYGYVKYLLRLKEELGPYDNIGKHIIILLIIIILIHFSCFLNIQLFCWIVLVEIHSEANSSLNIRNTDQRCLPICVLNFLTSNKQQRYVII